MKKDEPVREEEKALELLRAFGVFANTQEFSARGNDGVPWAQSGGSTGMTIEQAFRNTTKEFET